MPCVKGISKLISDLTDFEAKAGRQKTLREWADFLDSLTDRFFPRNNETLMDRRRVQKAIQSITNEFAKLSEKSKVPLRVIRYHLGNVLETGSPQGRFLTSGLLFVVCVRCVA